MRENMLRWLGYVLRRAVRLVKRLLFKENWKEVDKKRVGGCNRVWCEMVWYKLRGCESSSELKVMD